MIDENQLYINVTENVPNLQSWTTTINHHESLPVEINTMKNLECEHLGDRLRTEKSTKKKDDKNSMVGVLYENIQGLLPVKEELKDIFSDVVLNGKLVFYEKGMIFVDNRYHAIVMPYEQLKTMTIFQANEWWLKVEFASEEAGRDLIAHNLTVQPIVYLKVDIKFFKDKFSVLEKQLLIDQETYTSKMKNVYEECPYVYTSQTWRNFEVNKKYNQGYSCDFLNVQFQLEKY